MDLSRLDRLRAPDGMALLDRLAGEELDADGALRLGSELRATLPPALVADALTLAGLRRRARAKFRLAERMWLTREGLEQASGELPARHRAGRYAGRRLVADLCAGVGGDLIALAAGREVLAVDRDPVRLRMAGLNAEAYAVAAGVRPWLGDVRDAPLSGVDAVFVDPSRRAEGRRSGPLSAEPPLHWCVALAARVPAVGVKTAPGLPRELVPAGWEVEFVSVGRALKEAALWSPALATTARRATLLPGGHSLTASPGAPVRCAAPGAYVVDPDPAVTRAGLVEQLARALEAWKLDPRGAFLSADRPPRTPFGRTLAVVDSLPWGEKALRRSLRRLGAGSVDVRKRGSPVDVERLLRRLDLGGDARLTVLLTRVLDRPWALVCREP